MDVRWNWCLIGSTLCSGTTGPPVRQHDHHAECERILQEIEQQLFPDAEYLLSLRRARERVSGLHVAVMNEPFLSDVIDGRKSIESRFSQRRTAPYGRVDTGDLILFKKPAGPIVAVAVVAGVLQFQLNEHSWQTIRCEYGASLCVGESFLCDRAEASYATLMWLQSVRTLSCIRFEKRDRRGWVVLSLRRHQLGFL